MICKECGKKVSIFSRVMMGDACFCKDCYGKLYGNSKRWKRGIPRYKKEDVMTEQDLIDYAMDNAGSEALASKGFEIQEIISAPGETAYCICTKDGRKCFVAVRLVLFPEETKLVSYLERRAFLDKADEQGAYCYYINALIKPKDLERAQNGLYLREDDFHITFTEPKEIYSKVSQEWVQETLDKIELLKPDKGEEDSFPRVEFLYGERRDKRPEKTKYALKIEDEFSRFNSGDMPKTFQEKLLELISEKGMTNPEFYNAAMMDRKLFSAINKDRFYKPKKETAVACCFGLKLNLKDAESLLEAAGYKLSLSILWDRIIYFCLDHKITDLDVVNDLLYAKQQKCIGVLE